MPLAYSDEWNAAHRNGCAPVIVVEVHYLDVTEKTTYFRRGILHPEFADANVKTYPDSVLRVTHVGQSIDPVMRTQQTPSMTIDFSNDGAAKALFSTYRTHGFIVKVHLGFDALAWNKYEVIFAGYIKSVQPKTDGTISVKVNGIAGLLKELKTRGYFFPQHPLQVIKTCLTGINASFKDLTTLDPSDASYATVSHFVVEKGIFSYVDEETEAIVDPVPVAEIIDEMTMTLYGSSVFDDDGQFRFKLYSSSASSDDDWTTDDLVAGTLSAESLDANQFSRVTVNCGMSNEKDNSKGTSYSLVDSNAVDKHFWGLLADPQTEKVIDLGWVDGLFVTRPTQWTSGSVPADNGQADVVILRPAVCGSNWWDGSTNQFPSGTQPSWAQLSSSKFAYFIAEGEIITADAMAPGWIALPNMRDAREIKVPNVDDTGLAEVTYGPFPGYCYIDLAPAPDGRGSLGTTAITHATNDWQDITIAVRLAQVMLNRFKDGAPLLKCRTNLSKSSLQIGDTVTITSDQVWLYGASSLSTSQKWEIIGKSYDLDSGEIEWRLCYKTTTSATGTSSTNNPYLTKYKNTIAALAGQASYRSWVISGLTVTNSGLVITIAAGTIQIGTSQVYVRSVQFTLVASKDYYVYFDPATSGLIATMVANGDPQPDAIAGRVLLAKCVTDATTVTSIDDLRVTTGIVGGVVIDGSIVTGKLADDAVTAPKIATNAVIWEKLAQSNADNLVDNPGFEMGDIGWNHETGWTIEQDANARSGGYVAKHVTGVANAATKSAHWFSCAAGDRFYMSGWFKGTSTPSGSAKVRIQWRDADGVATSESDGETIVPTGTYEQSYGEGTCPSGSVSGELQFVVLSHTGGIMWADDGVINRVEESATIGTQALVPSQLAAKFTSARPTVVVNPTFTFTTKG